MSRATGTTPAEDDVQSTALPPPATPSPPPPSPPAASPTLAAADASSAGLGGSCTAYGCGGGYHAGRDCQCNTACKKFESCCDDYDPVCQAEGPPEPAPAPAGADAEPSTQPRQDTHPHSWGGAGDAGTDEESRKGCID